MSDRDQDLERMLDALRVSPTDDEAKGWCAAMRRSMVVAKFRYVALFAAAMILGAILGGSGVWYQSQKALQYAEKSQCIDSVATLVAENNPIHATIETTYIKLD